MGLSSMLNFINGAATMHQCSIHRIRFVDLCILGSDHKIVIQNVFRINLIYYIKYHTNTKKVENMT